MAKDYLTDAFIRLRQKLKVVSGRMLPAAEDAEDILQESFVRLWQRQYPLQSEKEADALLAKTVRNASLNERRRKHPIPLETDMADDPPDQIDKEKALDWMQKGAQPTDSARSLLKRAGVLEK